MFRRTCMLALLLCISFFSLGKLEVAQGEGIIFYESFEEANDKGAPVEWGGPGIVDSEFAKDGKSSLLVADDSETRYIEITSPHIGVSPDTTYTLTGWARTDDVEGDGSKIAIFIYEKDAEKKGNRPVHLLYFDRGQDWTLGSITFTTASATHFIQLYVYSAAGAGPDKKGWAWFDEIEIVKGAK